MVPESNCTHSALSCRRGARHWHRFVAESRRIASSRPQHPRCKNVDVVVLRAFASFGCGMPRWRSTGRFRSNAAQCYEHDFTRGQHGVLRSCWRSCLDLFCRQTSLQSTCSIALMDPATALIGLAVKVEGCLSHREDSNRLFGTAPRVQLRSGA